MNPERYQRIREIYHAACVLSGQARAELLERECAGEAELLEEVQSLLEHHDDDRTDALSDLELGLGRKILAAGASGDGDIGADPECVGRYRICRRIGEGGMGIVFEAEQDHPKRRVALKLVRLGFGHKSILRRFQHEAEMLGRLRHAGIAHIYESGLYQTPGRAQVPYLAMELIDGVPLTEYADQKGLTTRERLTLFTEVCEAIEHAHRNGVIHRDLKPGNVLVNAEGKPKVLDFGIARATDADVRMTTMQTSAGQLLGTIPYMSPEQASGDPAALDTRSDVYSLGVVLYELLTGRLPYDLQHRSIADAVRVIQETDATRAGSISPACRGDVETILAKALEKEKARRYGSAAELAADIRRHLADLPLIARPPSAVYQLRKFARRNRGLVGGVAAAVVVLVLGTVVSTGLAISASRERATAEAQRDRAIEAEKRAQQLLAEAEAARDAEQAQRKEAIRQTKIARAVNDFLNEDLLAAVSPEEQGKDVTMQDVLAAASTNIAGKFENEPEVEIAIRDTIANTYRALGKFDQVIEHLEANLALERKLLGPDHRDTLITQNNLAMTYKMLGRMEDAERLYKKTLEDRRRALGEDHEDVYESMLNLGALYWELGRNEEAYPMMARVLERYRVIKGDDHADTLDAINNLSLIALALGHYDEAVALSKEAVETRRRVLGADHPATLVSVTNAGVLLTSLGRYAEAQAMHEEAHRGFLAKLGAEHPNTIITLGSVGDSLRRRGMYDEAEKPLTDCYEACVRLAGPDHRTTLGQQVKQAALYIDTGRIEQAEPLAIDAVQRCMDTIGWPQKTTIRAVIQLCRLYLKTGRAEEALPLATKGLEQATEGLGATNFEILRLKRVLADIDASLNKPDEANRLYTETLAALRETLPADHSEIGVAMRQQGQLRLAQERFDEAESMLNAAYNVLIAALGDAHPDTQTTIRGLVDLYDQQGDSKRARQWRDRLSNASAAAKK